MGADKIKYAYSTGTVFFKAVKKSEEQHARMGTGMQFYILK